jgi:uncharacterized protein
VNQPRHPFRINVGFLFNQPIGYIREIPFEFPQLFFSSEYKYTNFQGIAALHRTQNGLRLLCSFKAETKATCVRCLEEFSLPVKTDFDEIFTFPYHPLSENEAVIPENGFLELEETIGDFLLLEIPINPICRDDCRGLCKDCGQNLNQSACNHHLQPDAKVKNSLKVAGKITSA